MLSYLIHIPMYINFITDEFISHCELFYTFIANFICPIGSVELMPIRCTTTHCMFCCQFSFGRTKSIVNFEAKTVLKYMDQGEKKLSIQKVLALMCVENRWHQTQMMHILKRMTRFRFTCIARPLSLWTVKNGIDYWISIRSRVAIEKSASIKHKYPFWWFL